MINWKPASTAKEYLQVGQSVLVYFDEDSGHQLGHRVRDAVWDGSQFRVNTGIVIPAEFAELNIPATRLKPAGRNMPEDWTGIRTHG